MDLGRKKVKAFLKQIFGENYNQVHELTGFEVVIGRNPKSHIYLLNLNISRRHCILTFVDNGWRIRDNKSQNGTFINGRKLEPDENLPLQCGDIVFLGPPSEMPEAFSYEEIMDCELENKDPDDDIVELPVKRACEQDVENSHRKIIKISENIPNKKCRKYSKNSTVTVSQNKAPRKVSNKKARKESNVVLKDIHISPTYCNANSDSGSLISNSCTDGGDQIYEISSTAVDHVENSESLINSGNADLVDPFFLCPGEEYFEVEDDNQTYRTNDIQQTTGKEKELESKLALLTQHIKALEESKLELLKNYEDVCEKNKALDQQLADKEKKLKEDLHINEVKAKNEIKSELLEKFEADLICNICTELFIKPIVLDCSHTFCEFCIKAWRKKKNDCPICRCKIKNVTRVRTLEEFIDNTLTSLTPDQRVKRDNIIAERILAEQPPKTATPRRQAHAARRRRRSIRPNTNNPINDTSIEIVEERPHSAQAALNSLGGISMDGIRLLRNHPLPMDGFRVNVPLFRILFS